MRYIGLGLVFMLFLLLGCSTAEVNNGIEMIWYDPLTKDDVGVIAIYNDGDDSVVIEHPYVVVKYTQNGEDDLSRRIDIPAIRMGVRGDIKKITIFNESFVWRYSIDEFVLYGDNGEVIDDWFLGFNEMTELGLSSFSSVVRSDAYDEPGPDYLWPKGIEKANGVKIYSIIPVSGRGGDTKVWLWNDLNMRRVNNWHFVVEYYVPGDDDRIIHSKRVNITRSKDIQTDSVTELTLLSPADSSVNKFAITKLHLYDEADKLIDTWNLGYEIRDMEVLGGQVLVRGEVDDVYNRTKADFIES